MSCGRTAVLDRTASAEHFDFLAPLWLNYYQNLMYDVLYYSTCAFFLLQYSKTLLCSVACIMLADRRHVGVRFGLIAFQKWKEVWPLPGEKSSLAAYPSRAHGLANGAETHLPAAHAEGFAHTGDMHRGLRLCPLHSSSLGSSTACARGLEKTARPLGIHALDYIGRTWKCRE
jgi:hypothetical protein